MFYCPSYRHQADKYQPIAETDRAGSSQEALSAGSANVSEGMTTKIHDQAVKSEDAPVWNKPDPCRLRGHNFETRERPSICPKSHGNGRQGPASFTVNEEWLAGSSASTLCAANCKGRTDDREGSQKAHQIVPTGCVTFHTYGISVTLLARSCSKRRS